MNPPSAPKKVGAAAGAPSGPPPKTPPVAPTANRPGATTGQTAMNSSRTGENQNGTLRGRPRGPGFVSFSTVSAASYPNRSFNALSLQKKNKIHILVTFFTATFLSFVSQGV